MKTLTPIYHGFEKPIDSCRRVRWIGSNGAWQLGLLLYVSDEFDSTSWVVLSEHTRTVVTLDEHEFEFDNPKDEAGNPK